MYSSKLTSLIALMRTLLVFENKPMKIMNFPLMGKNLEQDTCQAVHSVCQNENGNKAVTGAFIEGWGIFTYFSSAQRTPF